MASRIVLQHVRLSKNGILVLHGFGLKCRVHQSHFVAEWGVGLERYQIRLSRVEGRKLRRVVLISSDGYCSLEALRFISDVGASFSMMDPAGKLRFVCSPPAPSDAKLRRAQALALANGTALRLSKDLISWKLQAQAALVRDMLRDSETADAIERFRDELPRAEDMECVRLIESQGARCYWGAWSGLPILWPREDQRRVPAHWRRFASRISPLTHSPRLAANPPNATLNLLYSVLESECRIATIAMGLDSEIGLLHVDSPNRSSLACDIQEPIRVSVDAFLLNWLQREPLRKSDFWEDRNGNCRLTSSLAKRLCETAPIWRKLVAPVAEYVAQVLWSSIPKRSSTVSPSLIATRLTHRKKREAKGSYVLAVKQPTADHLCRGCGKKIIEGRTHCGQCAVSTASKRLIDAARIGRKSANGPEAQVKRANTQRKNALAQHAWKPSDQPAWLTEKFYSEKVQPILAMTSASAIVHQISVSRWYAGRIREGYRPHPRHWKALAELVGRRLGQQMGNS